MDPVLLLTEAMLQGKKRRAQLLILREALRLKVLGITAVACFDKNNNWSNLIGDKVSIHWEIYPTFNDICLRTKQLQMASFS